MKLQLLPRSEWGRYFWRKAGDYITFLIFVVREFRNIAL